MTNPDCNSIPSRTRKLSRFILAATLVCAASITVGFLQMTTESDSRVSVWNAEPSAPLDSDIDRGWTADASALQRVRPLWVIPAALGLGGCLLCVAVGVIARRRRIASGAVVEEPGDSEKTESDTNAIQSTCEIIRPSIARPATAPVLRGDGRESTTPAIYEPPPHEVVVAVIGQVECRGREVKGIALEILAMLTFLRETNTLSNDLVRATLDRDDNPGTVPNNLSRLRKSLGTSVDGDELLTRAIGGRYSDGSFELSALVVSDVALLSDRQEASLHLKPDDALNVLQDGLGLIRGPLFRARRGYAWVTPEGALVNSHRVVTEYCERTLQLAARLGDDETVIRAACAAGQAGDDPITGFTIDEITRRLERPRIAPTSSPSSLETQ